MQYQGSDSPCLYTVQLLAQFGSGSPVCTQKNCGVTHVWVFSIWTTGVTVLGNQRFPVIFGAWAPARMYQAGMGTGHI
jgi:hypothetical protein